VRHRCRAHGARPGNPNEKRGLGVAEAVRIRLPKRRLARLNPLRTPIYLPGTNTDAKADRATSNSGIGDGSANTL
jgi:hypothetical protein